MNKLTVLPINQSNQQHLLRPNAAFEIIGHCIALYDGEVWSHKEVLLPQKSTKCFPDERLDPAEFIDCPDKTVLFCFTETGRCAGHVRLHKNWNHLANIDDIEVEADLRGQGIGHALINAAVEWAKAQQLKGIVLEAQDCNLLACRFYLNYGFVIGGADSLLYEATARGEKAIFFYYWF